MLLLSQILDADALQNSGNGLVDARQRFLDGAAGGELAGLCAFCTGGDEQRPVDGMDDLEGRDLARVACQSITAVHPGVGAQKPHFGEPLQDLGQQLRGNPIGVGHVLGAVRRGLWVLGKILESHQPIIRFLGEF